jgi:cystinosin
VRRQYHDAHGSGSVPVQLNDVIFSLHAVVLIIFTIFQCFIYERGFQKVSKACKIQSAVVWLGIAVAVSLGLAETITYYQTLVLLSFVKLWASFIKYTPQAYLNWVRKSTVGWNIINVLLDFGGGLLSIMQMVFLAIDQDDANQVTGNPAKLGLGLESLFFDAIFIFQHYALYTDRRDLDAKITEDGDPSPVSEAVDEGEEAQLLPLGDDADSDRS